MAVSKQAVWQVYLPALRHIHLPKFDLSAPNQHHQADLLYLPYDRMKRKIYKHALTVVDVASRYKHEKPLTTKDSTEVAGALERIHTDRWPKLLQVDPVRGIATAG